jgi:hypothetical protein
MPFSFPQSIVSEQIDDAVNDSVDVLDVREDVGGGHDPDLHTVPQFLDHANISTSSRYLKPSKLALHTTIRRIDEQRRKSGEAEVGTRARRNAEKLAAGATKRPQTGKISSTTYVRKRHNRQ